MKAIMFYLFVNMFASLLNGQSNIVYGSATSLYVGTGSDLCAATITINGTFSGEGTFCNAPADIKTENDIATPSEFTLSQNYPNPFNPITTIKYLLPERSNVTLNIFDVLGTEIETLVNEEKQTGTYEINWHAENFPSGVYYYQIRSGNFIETKKMILLK